MILLDTDILIDILRNYKPAIDWLKTNEETLSITGFSAMELIQGCDSKIEIDEIKKFISKFKIIWLNEYSSAKSVELFAQHRLRNKIGLIDCIIAQISIENNLELHTFNIKHFKSIKELQTIQPYQKSSK